LKFVDLQLFEGGIFTIQDTAREIGDSFIGDFNKLFDTNAKFHSSFLHYQDESNIALETSGVVSGKGTISAVYTMQKEDTNSMYEKISAILLPKIIRDSGGFYDVAKKLSNEPNARMTFSIIPQEVRTLFQLRSSVNYPNSALAIDTIDPLKFLKINQLKKSNYFSQGFYPLNSILQVVVLPSEPSRLSCINDYIIPKLETAEDISKNGWIFTLASGDKIDGRYIFGDEFTIDKNNLVFGIESLAGISAEEYKITECLTATDNAEQNVYLQFIIVGGICIFFLHCINCRNCALSRNHP